MPITDYYVTTDAMGSVMAVLDETGNVLERRSYDAFGEATYMLADGTVVPNSPTGVDIGFQGQLIDELTGMYQMGYRWYSPVSGRWVSRDPIGLEGGVNPMAFVGNRPLFNVDPSGLGAVAPPTREWPPCRDEKNENEYALYNLAPHFQREVSKCTPNYTSLSQPDRFASKLEPGRLDINDLLRLEFHWWGFYGGPGFTNGGSDRDSRTPWNKVGPPYGPLPLDEQDRCYLKHDINHKACDCRWKNDSDINLCKARADVELSNCLWESIFEMNEGNKPKAFFSILFFRARAGTRGAEVLWK